MKTEFVDYLKSQKMTEGTLRVYKSKINNMLGTIEKTEENITQQDLTSYLANYSANVQNSTAATTVIIIKRYFEVLKKLNLIADNPSENIEPPKHVYVAPKKALDYEQVQALFSACENPREKAIVSLFVSTGIREGELTSLKLSDYIDMRNKNENAIVIYGKGNKPRYIFFNEETIQLIDEYISSYRHSSEEDLLFTSNQGNFLKNNNLNGTIRKLAKRANISFWNEVTCHTLRRSAATIYSDSGVPIAVIKDMLGHSNIATTSRYIKNTVKKVEQTVSTFSLKGGN